MSSESPESEAAVDDPIEYFLDDLQYQGKSTRTVAAYERVLHEFESYLSGRSLSVDTANHRDCMAYVHQLRGSAGESTVATYASYLHRFYDYMMRVGTLTDNPMTLVTEEMTESINTDPSRRDISVGAMREFVRDVRHPLHRAIVVTLLKTGIRAGELCNLDRRDVHLTDPVETATPRAAIETRPGSMYVDDDPSYDAEYNGEIRTASNKRKRATTIPIDAELEAILDRWLAIRPDPVSGAQPLFVSTTDDWGRRLTPDMAHHVVTTHASDAGWYRRGGGAEENVTPHYFRHFFTTHLRDRTGDRGVVKYLRGDVAQDVIDTYTHDWGDRVRRVYEQNIYSVL